MKPIANCKLRIADLKQKAPEPTKATSPLAPLPQGRRGEPANETTDADGSERRTDGALKAQELAATLQISVRKVRDLVAERKIPVMRVGRLVRFDYAEVCKALTLSANNKFNGTSPQSSRQRGEEGGIQ